jgi:hypothetical protein
VQSLSSGHHDEERDDIKADEDILGTSLKSVDCVDELH